MENVRGFQCDCGCHEFFVYEQVGKYRLVCVNCFDQYYIKSDTEIIKCEPFTDDDVAKYNKDLKLKGRTQ